MNVTFVRLYRAALFFLTGYTVEFVYRLRVSIQWNIMRHFSKKHGLDKPLHVSLSTYPKRFSIVHLTLKSLLSQGLSADSVTLWIGHQHIRALPRKVINLQKYGLIIKPCDDIGPYTKVIYSLDEYPDSYILVVDDDTYYERNMVHELIREWVPGRNVVLARRCHEIKVDDSGKPQSYSSWQYESRTKGSDSLNFPTGHGGVLYPPLAFREEVKASKTFREICPIADDIWLYWMFRRNGLQCFNVGSTSPFYEWFVARHSALYNANVGSNKNDIQIQNMINVYGWPDSGLNLMS